ncbi:MAG: chemotaxis protein CheB [Candidatus Rokuibacteriota bacterium]|nr:MAG: chemotaxis protein CheB [Candidatus Rokubacteria bacterium]
MLNPERIRRDVIVVGASAGGVEALIRLFSELPADIAAAVAVVLHRSPVHETRLALVLGRRASLPVYEPGDGDPLKPGAIWLGPRDQHLLVEDGRLRLSRGPREHHTRPAIDPLFVSAARGYGSRVVGVVLSGTGDDGVRGLIAIKAAGGLSLVQDPTEALHSGMPRNALAGDRVNATLSLEDLASTLGALALGEAVAVDAPFPARE